MDFILQLFAWVMMIGIISILVIVHECGHFLVARSFGFQTPVFGIGLPFGPFVVVGHKWGTQFRIHAALLGGYVAIPELGDESQHDSEAYGVELQPFKKFPIWQRALVAFAGVGFNILFAYLIMFMMLIVQGEPNYETQIQGFDKKVLIAKNAGVKQGDILIGVDDIKVIEPNDAVSYLSVRQKKEVTLRLLREKKQVDLPLTTNEKGRVGMVLELKQAGFKKIEKSAPEIAVMAGDHLLKLTNGMMQALGMIGKGFWIWMTNLGKPPVGSESVVGPGDVHGILAVMKLGADIAKEQDWNQLFIFTILISIDLAIINLIPWPALDGGHLAFMLVEAVRGKPIGERAQGEIFRWGLISLLLLMVVIMVNDVSALITGKLDFKKNRQERKLEKKDAPDKPKAPGDAGSTGEEARPGSGSGETPAASDLSDTSSGDKPLEALDESAGTNSASGSAGAKAPPEDAAKDTTSAPDAGGAGQDEGAQ